MNEFKQRLTQIVLTAIESSNAAVDTEERIEVQPTAILFGEGSPLDSLGLVRLLIDVEEALADDGIEIALTDERAMSQRQSPFRSVPALVDYIAESLSSDVRS